MNAWLIVLTLWVQDFLDRPRRKHLTTDPACVKHRAPRPGSWMDRASRGLECEPCMIRRALNDQGENPAYCESCEADRLWEEEGIQPVWASPTHTCGRAPATPPENREEQKMTVDTDPSADDHRDLIGFLRDNADELGIIAEPGGK